MLKLFRIPTDIPFARDDANRFLPWIVACMVCLAGLLLAVSFSLHASMEAKQSSYNENFTIQLPSNGKNRSDEAQSIVALLERVSDIRKAHVLNDAEVEALLAPWLGAGTDLSVLPLPTIIQAEWKKAPSSGRANALAKAVKEAVPDAEIDTHELWSNKLSGARAAAQTTLYTLSAFILATLALLMTVTSRTAMKLHASTVRLLHALGADDAYIAYQFQTNAFNLAFKGAVAGTFIALVFYAAFSVYLSALDVPLLPALAFGWIHVIVLIGLPLAASGIALFVARSSSLQSLRKLP